MKKNILFLCLALLVFIYGREEDKVSIDYCEGKSCYKCGADAETWCMGAVAEAYTPADRYENMGSFYRIFYCQKCWDEMPKAESPF